MTVANTGPHHLVYEPDDDTWRCANDCGRTVHSDGTVISAGDDVPHIRINPGSQLPQINDDDWPVMLRQIGPRIVPLMPDRN